MREALRDMLIAAGADHACETFRKAHEVVRKPEIMGGMPAPAAARDKLWAATEALKAMDLHSQRWEIARDVDYKLIRRREGH